MIEDWKGQPSATMTDYDVARIGYNNTVHGVPPTAEEVHNLACAYQTSQARLSEAVKVLERIGRNFEDGQSLPGTAMADIANDFLATLGEEK